MRLPENAGQRSPGELVPMFEFLIGVAFVAIVIGPALTASIQRIGTRDRDA